MAVLEVLRNRGVLMMADAVSVAVETLPQWAPCLPDVGSVAGRAAYQIDDGGRRATEVASDGVLFTGAVVYRASIHGQWARTASR